MALGQNLVALVNINIAGKSVFTPLTLILIGFDTHPYEHVLKLLDPPGKWIWTSDIHYLT